MSFLKKKKTRANHIYKCEANSSRKNLLSLSLIEQVDLGAFGGSKKLLRIMDLMEWSKKNLDNDILRVCTSETTSIVKR